jgi:hypothetical protein
MLGVEKPLVGLIHHMLKVGRTIKSDEGRHGAMEGLLDTMNVLGED